MRQTLLWAIVSLCWLCCDNPFFPPSGMPGKNATMRHTPQGVINQLIKSYEYKRLDMFRDLFSAAGTYRFYISNNYVAEYNQIHGSSLSSEQIDTPLVADMSSGPYYYWTYVDEIKKHEKLFEAADDIQFTALPVIPADGVQYRVTTSKDTLQRDTLGDSVHYEISTVVDTPNAVVVLRGGDIMISSNQLSEPVDVNIQEQVFYLARDPVDATLWVIDKWFDLETQY